MNIAIVGATGNVGRKILEVLEKRNLPIDDLYFVASSKSAGSKLKFKGKDIEVENLELSMTIVFSAALCAHFSATELPAAKKAIFTLEKSNFSKSITICSLPLKLIFFPELLEEATKNNSEIGKFLFSKTSMIFLPTFPVAPTIAIFMMI